MKLAPSNRTLALLFIAILAVSVINTILIVYSNQTLQMQRNKDIAEQNRALNQTNTSLNQTYISLNQTDYVIKDLLNGKIDNIDARLPLEQYDYVIYRYWDPYHNVSEYLAKNGRTGVVDYNSTNAATVFNQALSSGKSIYVKADEYTLTSDIQIMNKKNSRLDSDGAVLTLNGNKLTVSGSDFEHSQNNQLSGLIVVNGTVRIQNSFRTTVTNIIIENSTVGLELANTNTWTEGTRIDTVHLNKCTQGLVFRTNTSSPIFKGNSTGSFANTEVNRCYFNQLDNSIAITVEKQAEFTDGQMQDIRIWIGEFGKYNQTGLQLDGSMYKTMMNGVVFESFAPSPLKNASLYAIKIGPTAFQSAVLESAVNFLGNWTARVFNPNSIWIYGVGGVFKETGIEVPIGSENYGEAQVFQVHPATIASFKPKITVQGDFLTNETVTVRIRLEFVDNVVSSSVEKTFNNNSSVWLSDDDFLKLYAYPDVIYAILIDAKVSTTTTDATVQVDFYGMTT
jgi:hypothetical protein